MEKKSLQWIIELENLQLTFYDTLRKDTVNKLSSQYIYISHNTVGKQYYKILDIDIMSPVYIYIQLLKKQVEFIRIRMIYGALKILQLEIFHTSIP